MNLWLDEAGSYFMSQQPVSFIWNSLDFHPPAYYFLLKFWIFLFGDSIIAMRSLTVIIALITVVISVKIFKLFSRDKVSLSFFLVNLALNTTFLYHSTQIRQYALGLMFVVLTVYLFMKGNNLFFIPMTLALYTHYFTILAFIPFIIYYKEYWEQFVFSFVMFLPYIPVLIMQIQARLGSPDWFGAVTWNTLFANYFNYTAYVDIISSEFILGLVIFLTAFYFILVVKELFVAKNNIFLAYLFIPVFYIAFCYIVLNIYNPRYFYFLSIFFLIPVFTTKLKIKYVFVLFTIMNLFVAVNYWSEQDYELETISDYVLEHRESEVLVFESPMSLLPVMYYTRGNDFRYILVPYQPIGVYGGHLIEQLERDGMLEIDTMEEIKKIKKKNIYYFQNSYYVEGKKILQLKGISLILS